MCGAASLASYRVCTGLDFKQAFVICSNKRYKHLDYGKGNQESLVQIFVYKGKKREGKRRPDPTWIYFPKVTHLVTGRAGMQVITITDFTEWLLCVRYNVLWYIHPLPVYSFQQLWGMHSFACIFQMRKPKHGALKRFMRDHTDI